jgi:hypothetical protein
MHAEVSHILSDVPNGNTAIGTKLQIWACTPGDANQQLFFDLEHGSIQWGNKEMCVDLTNGSLANGNQVCRFDTPIEPSLFDPIFRPFCSSRWSLATKKPTITPRFGSMANGSCILVD